MLERSSPFEKWNDVLADALHDRSPAVFGEHVLRLELTVNEDLALRIGRPKPVVTIAPRPGAPFRNDLAQRLLESLDALGLGLHRHLNYDHATSKSFDLLHVTTPIRRTGSAAPDGGR